MLNKEVLKAMINSNDCNLSKTADELEISRPTLYELMAKYGLVIFKNCA